MKRRDEVVWFSDQMERVLRQNDYKGGWKTAFEVVLLERLRLEVDELHESIYRPTSGSDVVKECVDVANYAMMIADIVDFSAREEEPEPDEES